MRICSLIGSHGEPRTRVCTNIVIYCFFSHVSYQVQRGGEKKKVTKIAAPPGLSSFSLSHPLTSRLRLQARALPYSLLAPWAARGSLGMRL